MAGPSLPIQLGVVIEDLSQDYRSALDPLNGTDITFLTPHA
jgi:hypothetical protein